MRLLILIPWLILQLGGFAATPTKPIHAGWFEWAPYGYAQTKRGYRELTGMDVELVRAAFQRIGYRLDLSELSWEQQMHGLTNGAIDIAYGAVPEDAPLSQIHVSAPYREEKIRLHLRHDALPASDNDKRETLEVLAKRLHAAKLTIGVGRAYSYGRQVDAWLSQFEKTGMLVRKANENELMVALQAGQIDAIVADELVIATISSDSRFAPRLDLHPRVLAQNDVYVLFGRKTCDTELVTQFNGAIQSLRDSGEYRQIIREYFFPLVLRKSASRPWFYWIEMIGIVAAGASGLLLARQANYTISGTVVLVFLASQGGGFARDLISERSPNLIVGSPVRVWVLLTLAIGGTAILRFCDRIAFFQRIQHHGFLTFLDNCADALGKAAFTVFGVVVAIQTKCEPVYLWGPCFSVIGSLGGGLVRDIVANTRHKSVLKHGYYAHVLFAWGLFFSMFLMWESNHLQANTVEYAFFGTMAGVFLTTMAIKSREVKAPAPK